MSAEALQGLLQSLDLVEVARDRYEGLAVERERPRTFGGEFLGQVVIAAARTARDRVPHSLHVNFMAPGNPARPVEYRVGRVRDGRRFAQRQISGWQSGRQLLLATVSLARAGPDALVHQHERMPEVPGPEGLTSELDDRLAVADRMRPQDRRWLLAPRGVEVRQVRPVPLFDPPPVPPVAHTWMRALGPLPDDPAVHCAVLAYASDTTLLDIACYPHGLSWIDPRARHASLDHAMWFHRAARADEWVLFAQAVPSVAAGRAFARGTMFARDGAMAASVTQEGLWEWLA